MYEQKSRHLLRVKWKSPKCMYDLRAKVSEFMPVLTFF